MEMASSNRVLIVHQDKTARRVLGFMLEKEGLQALTTGDWDEAWEWVREGMADAALIEVSGVGAEYAGSAIAFLQALRLDKGLGNYPVGALCADRRLGVACLKAGASVFWEMPVMNEEFQAGVLGLLAGRARELSNV